MNLAQAAKIVYVIESDDNAGAGKSGDSVNMSNYNHGCWIFQFGDITGDSVLTMESGASDGTETTAETFRYRLSAADVGAALADQLGAETTSASLTLTAATFNDRMLVVEMDTDELTEDQPFMTPVISAVANPLDMACVCILTEARYLKDVPAPAIPIA